MPSAGDRGRIEQAAQEASFTGFSDRCSMSCFESRGTKLDDISAVENHRAHNTGNIALTAVCLGLFGLCFKTPWLIVLEESFTRIFWSMEQRNWLNAYKVKRLHFWLVKSFSKIRFFFQTWAIKKACSIKGMKIPKQSWFWLYIYSGSRCYRGFLELLMKCSVLVWWHSSGIKHCHEPSHTLACLALFRYLKYI